MRITVSAPGKIHLSGEHSVVYGKPAVLVATDKRLRVTIKNSVIPAIHSVIPAIHSVIPAKAGIRIPGQAGNDDNISQIRKTDKYINHICTVFENTYQLKIENFKLKIDSDVPVGRGMGSSASLAVALIGALTIFYKKPWDLAQINNLAYEAEKFQHQNPSGGDISLAVYGGLIWYRKEFEFLKTLQQINFQIPNIIQEIIIVNSQRTETTGDLVKSVKKQFDQNPIKIEKILSDLEKTTKNILFSIYNKNIKDFFELITQNQKLLTELGIVSKKVCSFIKQLEKAGGAGKISGAGGIKTGSGMILCWHKNQQKIIDLASIYKWDCFAVKLSGCGVKKE